ncbi:hypothetical protein [Methylobacterium gregans]|uniref:Uncharacterized protein n=1 Tax=Methylobacterium gregans TaxID=374424 RepID=A0AA37HVC0_9HYPH|nr:hypothetical protein [Methylobacterium gregans]MDQ0520846.1 hypothetical protein [Methylobacterium gregans]GJD81292.1 hypothetical protein NBEOAGPD_4538 [Methylobacterium gregans]
MRILLPATILAGAVSALCLAAPPVRAQGVPPNPFASNYPSAPPPPYIVEQRERRMVRARRPRGAAPAETGLLPPGRVPY